MKFYNAPSGNTKRVRIFIAEKGLDIPRVELGLGAETRGDEFRKINSLAEVPVLELDDGQIITESRAICRYLDTAFPENNLMGCDAFEIGQIAMWSERMHGQIFMTFGLMVRHSLEIFEEVVDQIPKFAQSQRAAIPQKWAWLDTELADERPFIAGDRFSFADIEGMTALTIADAFKMEIPETCVHVRRWADAMRRRPSWDA